MSEDIPIPSVFVQVTDDVIVEVRNSWAYSYDPAVEYTDEQLDELIELEVKSLRMTRRNFAPFVAE